MKTILIAAALIGLTACNASAGTVYMDPSPFNYTKSRFYQPDFKPAVPFYQNLYRIFGSDQG